MLCLEDISALKLNYSYRLSENNQSCEINGNANGNFSWVVYLWQE